MSRVGNRIIIIPAGVTVSVSENIVTVKGPKGELSLKLMKTLQLKLMKMN